LTGLSIMSEELKRERNDAMGLFGRDKGAMPGEGEALPLSPLSTSCSMLR